ncbi:MAG: Sec-independent protein translocase protein TatC, partial [Pedosphaera sp.]|nr:Sec-independent protein translocase protein TatC [Pedosphaera sp.]
MAIEPEEDRPFEEDEGGPVKSFLDHLEDLRWVLMKIVVTLGVAMLICLISGNYMVAVLRHPLEKAQINYPGNDQIAVLLFGTNRLGTYHLDAAQQAAFHFSTNRFVAVQLEPSSNGTNLMLGLKVDSSVDAEKLAKQMKVDLNTLSPAGGFYVAFQVAIYAGIAISSPLLFYFIAQFVFPALKMKEKRYVYRGLAFSVPLFLTGASFCYFILMPVALSASQFYSNWLGFSANIWRAEEYISFVSKFILGMGLGFEMPVVILVLVKLGILNYSMLSKGRRYAIVINLILGALLTTPEVLTQVLMALPLQVLYEV